MWSVLFMCGFVRMFGEKCFQNMYDRRLQHYSTKYAFYQYTLIVIQNYNLKVI